MISFTCRNKQNGKRRIHTENRMTAIREGGFRRLGEKDEGVSKKTKQNKQRKHFLDKTLTFFHLHLEQSPGSSSLGSMLLTLSCCVFVSPLTQRLTIADIFQMFSNTDIRASNTGPGIVFLQRTSLLIHHLVVPGNITNSDFASKVCLSSYSVQGGLH